MAMRNELVRVSNPVPEGVVTMNDGIDCLNYFTFDS